MLRSVLLLCLCLVFGLLPCASSQGPMAPPRSQADSSRTYDNSPDGLRWQLQDILNAARAHNSARLESLIKLTEIPAPEWFTRTFNEKKAASWSKEYKEDLVQSEQDMEGLMTLLAEEDGEFWVRNIKYERAPARQIEGVLIDSLQRPVNIWYASWKVQNSPPGSSSSAIGYFVFIDGRFRWDSAVTPADVSFVINNSDQRIAPKIFPVAREPQTAAIPPKDGSNPLYQPGLGGVGVPECIDCPPARYSNLARRKMLEGTVLLQIVVQPDGSVADPQIVKSPDAELSNMALEGVRAWRFKPARRSDGEALPVLVMVEMNFRLGR